MKLQEMAKQISLYCKRHPNATGAEMEAFARSLLPKRAKGFRKFKQNAAPNVSANKAQFVMTTQAHYK